MPQLKNIFDFNLSSGESYRQLSFRR